jgi:hypothetical protein
VVLSKQRILPAELTGPAPLPDLPDLPYNDRASQSCPLFAEALLWVPFVSRIYAVQLPV